MYITDILDKYNIKYKVSGNKIVVLSSVISRDILVEITQCKFKSISIHMDFEDYLVINT